MQEPLEPTPLTREQAVANLRGACQNMAEACSAAVDAGVPIHEVMQLASSALVNPGA